MQSSCHTVVWQPLHGIHKLQDKEDGVDDLVQQPANYYTN